MLPRTRQPSERKRKETFSSWEEKPLTAWITHSLTDITDWLCPVGRETNVSEPETKDFKAVDCCIDKSCNPWNIPFIHD